jgi:hypothetical protein
MADPKRPHGVGVYDRPAAADRPRALRRLAPWLLIALVLLSLLVWLLL